MISSLLSRFKLCSVVGVHFHVLGEFSTFVCMIERLARDGSYGVVRNLRALVAAGGPAASVSAGSMPPGLDRFDVT